MGPFHASTASPLEVLWTLAALAGLGVGLWMLRDAQGDRRALRQAGLNGARLLVARGAIRWERIRAGKMALFALVGLLALTRPNAPQTLTPQTLLYSALALYVPLANLYGSVQDRRERAQILADLAEKERHRAQEGC